MIHKSRDIFLSREDFRNMPGKALYALVGLQGIIESDIHWEVDSKLGVLFASWDLSMNYLVLYFHGGRMDIASTSWDDSISFQRGSTPKWFPNGHTYDMTLSRSLSAIWSQLSLVKSTVKGTWAMKGQGNPAWSLQLPPRQLNNRWPSVGWQRLRPEPLCTEGMVLDHFGSGEHVHVYLWHTESVFTPGERCRWWHRTNSVSVTDSALQLGGMWGVSRQFYGWQPSTSAALFSEASIYNNISNCRSWRREEPALHEAEWVGVRWRGGAVALPQSLS